MKYSLLEYIGLFAAPFIPTLLALVFVYWVLFRRGFTMQTNTEMNLLWVGSSVLVNSVLLVIILFMK